MNKENLNEMQILSTDIKNIVALITNNTNSNYLEQRDCVWNLRVLNSVLNEFIQLNNNIINNDLDIYNNAITKQ